MNPKSEQTPAEQPVANSLQIGNVLKLVLPVLAVLMGAIIFFGVFDGAQWLKDRTQPPIVSVTGLVLFNGEPLSGAEIATQPAKQGLRSAIGATDEQGHFNLKTEVNGDFLDGAYAGEHVVTVVKRHNVTTFGVPPAMTPEKYASFAASPLRMLVSEGLSIELRLEGELSDPPTARPPMQPMRPPGDRGAEEPATDPPRSNAGEDAAERP